MNKESWVSSIKKLAHSNAECGIRNAEYRTLSKIVKAEGREQRA